MNHAVYDDGIDFPDIPDVLVRLAVYRDQVGEFARLNVSEFVITSHDPGPFMGVLVELFPVFGVSSVGEM